MKKHALKWSTLASAILLTACGGGSSSSTPFAPKAISGTAVDFHITGADVDFTNPDCETAYPDLKTDQDGKFSFTTTEKCQETGFIITGGIDTVTQLPFQGTLKVKSSNYQAASTTEIVASPLTTLQAELPAADFARVLADLGFNLNEDVTTFDPIAEGTDEQKAAVFVLQQIFTKLESSGLTLTQAAQAIQTASASTPLLTDSGVNSDTVSAVFTAAIASTNDTKVKEALTENKTNLEAVTSIVNTALTSAGSTVNLED